MQSPISQGPDHPFQRMNWLIKIYSGFLLCLAQLIRSCPFLFPAKIVRLIRRSDESFQALRTAESPWIWFHAASGEVEHLRPLFLLFKSRCPHLRLILTLTSESLLERAQKFEDLDEVHSWTLDTNSAMAKFLSPRPPEMALIAKSDWWPVMLHTLAKMNVPIYVVAYFTSSESEQIGFWQSHFFRWATRNLTTVFGIQELPEKLQRNLRCPYEPLGDPRWDQVFFRKSDSIKMPPALASAANPNLITGVLASTWPEDERELFLLIEKFSHVRWIWAPHEPTEEALAIIERDLAIVGIPSLKLSQLEGEGKTWSREVLLIDRVGVLYETFRLAHFAFVGGSFRSRVHSVLEPLSHGLVTFIGPYHRNSAEALQFRQLDGVEDIDFAATPVVACRTGGELELQISALLSSHKDLRSWDALKTRILQKTEALKGASLRIFNRLPIQNFSSDQKASRDQNSSSKR